MDETCWMAKINFTDFDGVQIGKGTCLGRLVARGSGDSRKTFWNTLKNGRVTSVIQGHFSDAIAPCRCDK